MIVRQSPQDSAVSRAANPDASPWSLTNQLLALVGDYMAWQVWMGSKDGEKGRNKPKPIPRPGVEPDTEKEKFGSDPVALDELDAFLGWAESRVQEKKRQDRPRDERGRFVKRA